MAFCLVNLTRHTDFEVPRIPRDIQQVVEYTNLMLVREYRPRNIEVRLYMINATSGT